MLCCDTATWRGCWRCSFVFRWSRTFGCCMWYRAGRETVRRTVVGMRWARGGRWCRFTRAAVFLYDRCDVDRIGLVLAG